MSSFDMARIINISNGTVGFFGKRLRVGDSTEIRVHILKTPKIKHLIKTGKLAVSEIIEGDGPAPIVEVAKIQTVAAGSVTYEDIRFAAPAKTVDLSDTKQTTVDLTTSMPVYSDDLAAMSRAELLELAKEMGLDVTKKKKEDMIQAIRTARGQE